MNYTADCPHCGHRITAYTIPMNAGLAQSFVVFAGACIRLGRPVAKKELPLSNVQYTMFQKLRHFGLIAQPQDCGRTWTLTAQGLAWYYGRTIILTPAAWMGGKTLDEKSPAWGTHKEPRRGITIHDVLPNGWKQREEYAEEKSGT